MLKNDCFSYNKNGIFASLKKRKKEKWNYQNKK